MENTVPVQKVKCTRLQTSASNAKKSLVGRLRLLDQVYHAQRAMGSYKYREKYKCTDLELAQHLSQLNEQFRKGLVQLSVLKEAVDGNVLIKFLVRRRAKRIANELDRQEGWE